MNRSFLSAYKFHWKKYHISVLKNQHRLLLAFALALAFGASNAATITSAVSGNWNAASSWIAISRTGTITVALNGTAVVGSGTLFLTELAVGSIIKNSGGTTVGTVTSITDNTHLTITSAGVAMSGIAYTAQVVPGVNDDVIISGGFTITLDVTGNCNSLTLNGPTSNGTNQLTIGAFTLSVTNNVIMASGGNSQRKSNITFNSASSVLSVGGSLTIGSSSGGSATFDMSNGGTTNPASNLIIAGNMTFNSDGVFNSGTASTVTYNGTSQILGGVNYRNLNLSGGSGIKTPGGVISVGGNLTVSSGAILSLVGSAFSVTGTSSISGAVSTATSASTGNTFTGAVTINSGGSWDLSSQNPPTSFGSGIVMNGTSFNNGSGTATFSASQSLTGSANMTFGGPLSITGTLTNSNTGTVTITGAPTGSLTQGVNSILSLTTSAPSGTFDASTNANTVNYVGAAQTVKAVNYRNLGLAGSGNKTFSAAASINGNLSISGAAVALLSNGTTSSATTLTLGGLGASNGSWGGTTSSATNKSATYFGSSTTGIVNITTNSCTTPNVTNFSIPSATTVCVGAGSVVSVNSSSLVNGTYTVTYNVSGTNTISSTTASLVFAGGTGTFTTAALSNAGSANTVQVTSVAVTSIGCSGSVSASTTFSMLTSPTPTFTSQPGASACVNASVTYTTQSGQSNYVWSLPGISGTDYSIISGGVSSTDNTVTLKWLTTGSKTLTINYSNAGGCSAASPTSSTTTTVNALPSPTFTTQPGVSACLNTNVTYTTQSGQTNYVWNVPGVINTDYSITSGGLGSANNTVTLQWLTTGSKTVTINYTNSNGCTGASATSSTATTVYSAPSSSGLSATVAATTCAGSGILVSVTSSNLVAGTYTVTYTYAPSSGGTLTGQTSSMTFSPTTGSFTTVALGANSASVTITGLSIGGCSTSGLSISAGTSTSVALPDVSTIGATASGTDIGNTSGSSVTLTASQNKLSAGAYTVGYTVTDATGTTTYITSSKSVTLAVSTRKNKLAGTFTTGQISLAGSYKVNITSITASTGCTSSISGLSASFTVVGSWIATTTGKWDAPATWGNSTGTGPSYLDGVIIISAGVTVTYDSTAISDTLKLDQFIIYGTLVIRSDQVFKLKHNASSTDLNIQTGGKLQIGSPTNNGTINGTLILDNGATHSGTSSTAVIFKTGSYYKHLATTSETPPPLASWSSTSTFQVSGYTSTTLTFTSTNWSQAFGEVVWNCPSQTADINLNGLLGGANTIQGGVTISSTGSAILRFGNSVDYSLTISGDMTVSGSSRFSMGPSNGNGPAITLSMNNFVYGSTAATPSSWLCEAGIASIKVLGNISINSGTVFLSDGGASILKSGSTINLTGDLTVATGATFSASSANSGRTGLLIYNNLPGSGAAKTHSHTITGTGTIGGYMLYQIAANQTVKAIGESAFISTATAAGSFSVASTATLVVQSTDVGGAIQSGTTAGNIRIATAARAFASGATIEYNSTSTQVINGTGHPTTLGVDCRINNQAGTLSTGVSVSSTGGTVTIGGNLKVISGNMTVQENNVIVSGNTETSGGNIFLNTGVTNKGTTTLRTDGAINMTGGNIQMKTDTVNASNTSLLINGDLLGTNYFSFSGNNCQVTVGGTSPTTLSRDFPINGATSLEQLTMNRAGATLIVPQSLTVGNKSGSTYSGGIVLTNGNVKMNASLVVTTYATLTSGILYFENQTLEIQRNISVYPSGLLSANASSVLNLTTNFGGIADTLAFSSAGNTLGTLTLNRSANVTPHVRLYTPLTISGTLNLTDGEFYNQSGLAMANGATITRTGQSSFASGSAVPTGGPYNVIYYDYTNGTTGTNSSVTTYNTGTELQGSLNNVSCNVSGTLTLQQSIIGIGTLTVNSGAWTSGSNTVSMAALTNSGIFNAPSTTLTLTGNLTNNSASTFAHNSGIVIFNGTSSILFGANPLFNNVTISGTLNGPSLLKLVGNFTDNGTFSAGTGTVEFAGTTQGISGSSIPSFFDLLIDNTSIVTPVINVTSTDLLTNNGTFNSGANTVTLKNLTNNSTAIFVASSSNTNISGDITNNTGATFNNSNGTVNFNGVSKILGGSPVDFYNLTIGNANSLQAPVGTMNVARDFSNNGTFNSNSGIVYFNGTSKILGNSSIDFYSVTIGSGNSLLATSGTMNVAGDFTNAGTFANNGGTVLFNGSSHILGTSPIDFYNISIGASHSLTAPVDTMRVAKDFVSNGTFSHNGGTVKFNGNSTISGSPGLNHITISGVFTGPSILHLQGDFTNNGSFVSGANKVSFEGTALQKIKGSSITDFNHIDLTNSAYVSVESTHNLKGVLTLASSAVFDADGLPVNGTGSGVFTLLSTGDRPTTIDASIATLPSESSSGSSNNQVKGNVTVQRYMGRSGSTLYDYHVRRFISSPVQNDSVKNLQKYIPVTGPFTGSDSVGLSPSGYSVNYKVSSLQRYNETVITDTNKNNVLDFNDGWEDFPKASNSEVFETGRGYSIFIFGVASENANHNDLWALRGKINSGTITLPVSVTPSGGATIPHTYVASTDGWNLVGNPFPSTIDWGYQATGTPLVTPQGWVRNNISTSIYIENYDYNAAAGMVFATYNYYGGASTNGGSRYIATGQSFWVKNVNNLSTPVLTVNETAKKAGTQTTFLRESGHQDLVRLTLISSDNQRDETLIYFSDKATEGVDDYDALKRFNIDGYINLSSLSPAQDNYAINAMPLPVGKKIIPLEVSDVNTGTYTLSFTEFSALPASLRLQLEDKYENSITDIRENSVYTFKVDKGNPASFGSDRFTIVFGGEEIRTVKRINVYPVPVKGVITIEADGEETTSAEVINMVGLSIGTVSFSSDGKNQIGKYDFSKENSGMYFIRVKRNDQVSVVRIVRE